MSETHIIEPVGTCPITGYPLVAVHEVSGTHAGLALAYLAEYHRTRDHADDPDQAPRLAVESLASEAEMMRSWTELLLFAMMARIGDAPDRVYADYSQCQDLLRTRHHYDSARIIASVCFTAVEHLRHYQGWADPALALLPDVGMAHIRTATQTTITRLAGSTDGIPQTVDRLRGDYIQRLAETT